MKPPPGAPAAWMPYAMVKDAKSAAATATANGGKIVNGPMEVPGGDWIAVGIDPQGAMFAVHSLKPAIGNQQSAISKKAPKKKAAKKSASKKAKARPAKRSKPASAKATAGRPMKKKAAKKKAAKKSPKKKAAKRKK
jgi:hypothetical protein